MRILHVHSGNLFGGVETLLLTLARRGEEAGLVSEFALCFDGRLAKELLAANAPVHHLGEVRARNPLSVLRARRELRSLLAARRFDAAFVHSPWATTLFGSAIRDGRLPLAFYLHGEARCEDLLERWAGRNPPDLVFCNSRFTQGTLPRLFPRAANELVYYPVERRSAGGKTDRSRTRDELGATSSDTVIVQVSRMEEWKGHHLHLEALARVRDDSSWVCWQVGGAQRKAESEYLAGVKRRAEELGISERVRFLGERADVPALLEAADIHCQPNAGPEPFGITFIEALYSGLPVVTTAIGAAPEIVTDRCGVLVPPANPDALAAVLRRLVHDPAERQRLGAGGPERARQLCDPIRQIGRLRDALGRLSRR